MDANLFHLPYVRLTTRMLRKRKKLSGYERLVCVPSTENQNKERKQFLFSFSVIVIDGIKSSRLLGKVDFKSRSVLSLVKRP